MKFDELYESIMSDKEARAFGRYRRNMQIRDIMKNRHLHSEFPSSPGAPIFSKQWFRKREMAMNHARNRAAWEKNPVPPGTINKRPPPPFPDTRAKEEDEVIRKRLGSPI